MAWHHDPDQHSSHVVVAGRRMGKTTQLMGWLKEAKQTKSYPFWDRVLLVHEVREAQRLRIQLRQEAEAEGVADSGVYYNLVYSYEEWRRARPGVLPVEIAVDNIDFVLADYFRQTPSLVSIHGRPYNKLPWWKHSWLWCKRLWRQEK